VYCSYPRPLSLGYSLGLSWSHPVDFRISSGISGGKIATRVVFVYIPATSRFTIVIFLLLCFYSLRPPMSRRSVWTLLMSSMYVYLPFRPVYLDHRYLSLRNWQGVM
jgi:hypothetical protein